MIEYFFDIPLLDNLPLTHHDNTVSHSTDDAQVMADE
jgi:hypothetical protein